MSVTAADWASKVLSRLNLPSTSNNLNAMMAWMAFEGGHPFNPGSPFLFNPLNTTKHEAGSSSPGGVAGVQSYPDWTTGITGTVDTLKLGYYAQIRAALAADESPDVTLEAVKRSPWGTTAINPEAWPTLVAQIKNKSVSGSVGMTNPLVLARQHPILTLLGIAAATGVIIWLITKKSPLALLPGFAHENPARRRKRRRGKTHVQSLLFPRSRFTPAEAKSWARSHGYRAGKVDTTARYVRLRQSDPSKFSRMRTVKFGESGIKAVVGARS